MMSENQELEPTTVYPMPINEESVELPEAQEPDENFDIDDWISESKLPEKSVTIYRRGDLVADMDEIVRQINIMSDEDYESSIADTSVGELRKQYNSLVQEFRESGLKVRVRAVTEGDRKKAELKAKDYWRKYKENLEIDEDSLRGLVILSEVIVSPRMTIGQVVKLERAIGWGQVNQLIQAYILASGQQREPSVPLSRNSSRNRGGGIY